MTHRNPIARYARWLHTMWPAGTVEKLPQVNADFSTSVPGLYVVGDLTGIPLLKFSSDAGARAVQTIVRTAKPQADDVLDLVIIGAGVSGMAAALEARKANLKFEILEASEPFSTIVNFPKGKPIYTYPTDMIPVGDLQFRAEVHPKETLVDEIRAQTRDIKPRMARAERVVRKGEVVEVFLADQPPLRARNVIIGIGRSGNFRKLNVPGEDLGKVYNRLHDPKDFADRDVLVVGGGDSALETAIAIAECGGRVTLSYRKSEFSRPKPDNVEKLNKLMADPMADVQVESPRGDRVNTPVGNFMGDARRPGAIALMFSSQVKEIRENEVILTDAAGKVITLPNDAVFCMIGREAPLEFFRRSGIPIRGEWRVSSVISLVLVLLACVFIYHWKKGGLHIADVPVARQVQALGDTFAQRKWFPYNVPALVDMHAVLRISLGEPGFYYSLAYCAAVVGFGVARIRRRRTPYVTWQTVTLMAIQVVPLFLLPYLVLPWMGNNGWFDGGAIGKLADELFPRANYGHGREYWRAFGLILAWPLFLWNVFTSQPLWAWLGISFVQTFVLIPLIIFFWGKGAYCGWICSCGALAETLGDAHRHKMPHGPFWNRFNFVGQFFLLVALVLFALRAIAWIMPGSFAARTFDYLFERMPFFNYKWFVDLLWAGILGVGLYWHFSGRVWCRFACPLAALMHVYARFSRFRILADKKKCISCNVCTSVCHQGIDVMNFANKGLPMEDPQCVRCSACVQMCPTGVLEFGQIDRKTGAVIRKDPSWLAASPVLMREIGVNGKRVAV
jgi:thioredoxin reductase/polyferredoxin